MDGHLTASTYANACSLTLIPSVPRLPPELIREILIFLGQTDLRAAAAVSREFYAAAWRAGLVLHRNLNCERDKSCTIKFTELSQVVHHARSKNLRLSIALIFDGNGAPQCRLDASTTESHISEVLSLLQAALPILVVLCLSVTEAMVPCIAGLFRQPAPFLHTLFLGVHTGDSNVASMAYGDIFMGIAPALSVVGLSNVRVGPGPTAAFRGVRSLTLMETALSPDLAIAQHFPDVRSLSLCQASATGSRAAAIPFNFHGTHLERLVVEEPVTPSLMSALVCCDNPVDIPIIQYVCEGVEWTESLWRTADDGPFSIRLAAYVPRHTQDVSILVMPEHRRWYREYNVTQWLPEHGIPVADLPELTKRLTYLRMDNYYLIGFLECTELSFHALESMQVDFDDDTAHSGMVWPPDWIDAIPCPELSFDKEDASAATFSKPSYRTVDCTALKTLRLFAIYAETSVSSHEVAYLGRALSQCLRPLQRRAILELHGIKLHEPSSLVDETFSTVRQYGFTGWNGSVGRDSGLWDDWYISY